MTIFSTDDIAKLDSKFREIETYSRLQHASQADNYLCYRLDGIKASKTHLKDCLVNDRYNLSFVKAIRSVYFLLRNQTDSVNKNFFFCAFSASDEVSFVLNRGENYYKNRIFKIGTMLAGTLSSAMTIQFELLKPNTKKKGKKKNQSKGYPTILAFDSRPLIFKTSNDVKEYIKFRWSIACRNAACKVLRLESELSDDEIYGADLNNNVEAIFNEIRKYDLTELYNQAVSSFSLFVPDSDRKLKEFKLSRHENFEEMLLRLDEFLTRNV